MAHFSHKRRARRAQEEPEDYPVLASALNIGLCVGLLGLFGVLSLVMPKPTVSEFEKRELAKMPEFSAKSLFAGEYTRDVDLFYSDTFPFREGLVSFASTLDEMKGIRMDDLRIHSGGASSSQSEEGLPDILPPGEGDESTSSAPSVADDGAEGEWKGDMFIYKGQALSAFGVGGNMSMADSYAATINAYHAALGDSVKIYNIVIPTHVEFALPERYQSITQPQKPNIDYIYGKLDPAVIGVNIYDTLSQHRDEYLYFNTDHHWTALGAYYAYVEFCKAADLTPVPLSDFTVKTKPDFLGSLYSQSQDSQLRNNSDHVDYYLPSTPYQAYLYQRNQPFTPYATSLFAEYASGVNSYSVFLGGDLPLIRIDTGVKNGRKILMVKESFGNCFAPFLVNHYEQVYVVDQRYFQLGLVNFIQENGINELLFINNIFAANTGIRIQEIRNLMYQQYVPYVPPVEEPSSSQEAPPEDEEAMPSSQEGGANGENPSQEEPLPEEEEDSVYYDDEEEE